MSIIAWIVLMLSDEVAIPSAGNLVDLLVRQGLLAYASGLPTHLELRLDARVT